MISIHPIIKYDCDVLVVGGGPGGSAIAAHLAKAGVKVIVLEREKFPRDKVCGDAVSPTALNELYHLGITNSSAFSATNEIRKANLYFKEEKIAAINLPKGDDMPYFTRVIPRLQLDQWIYEAAQNAGAIFLENTQLTHYTIDENGVWAEVKQENQTRTLKAKVITGADGSNSIVARILHGSKPSDWDRLLALRAYYEGINGPADCCDIHFTGDNFPGLYWVFPTGPTTANIGLGMVSKTLPKNETHIKALLTNQIRNNKNLSERIGNGKINGKILGWPLTIYNPQKNIISDRLVLVGDAAGLINALSGDGIQYALLSARWASECLISCLQKGDVSMAALSGYQQKVHAELGYDFALSNFLVQVARNRTFNPVWMKILLILMERARTDSEYATILGGIFGGTHPSYKALHPVFLLKTLLQAGIHLGSNAATGISQGPLYWVQKGKDTGRFTIDVIQSIKEDPRSFIHWAGDASKMVWNVSGHVIKSFKANAGPGKA